MRVCNKASECDFFIQFVDQAEFREKHFKFYCFGPLYECCARRVYHNEHGKFPRALISPSGEEQL